jgi:hypothetical protein
MKRNTDPLPLVNFCEKGRAGPPRPARLSPTARVENEPADFARRRAYDWRAALLLIQQGVTEFATVNEKDFRDCGFQRVWNQLAGG